MCPCIATNSTKTLITILPLLQNITVLIKTSLLAKVFLVRYALKKKFRSVADRQTEKTLAHKDA